MSGQVAYRTGIAAEDQVAALYGRRGACIAARRWRGPGGEIDLVIREGARVVFVEVKAAANFARAAERLSRRQMDRIGRSAGAFLAGEPAGQLTEARFDVALVDRFGRISVIENAFEAA